MQQHDWIVEVCEDLIGYARKHELSHLEGQLAVALNAAKHDVLLAGVHAVHHPTRDCAVFGADIGICMHQKVIERDTPANLTRCC